MTAVRQAHFYAQVAPLVAVNAWLRDLCQAAGVPTITLTTLQQAIRPPLAAVYGNVVAGAILGQTVYVPVPDEQAAMFATYQESFHLPSAGSAPLAPVRPSRSPSPSPAVEPLSNYELEGRIARLQEAMQPLAAP
ncbi:MAG: hypothetical protein ACFFA6_17505, partial [Promethearchaeota archaeon]